LHLEKYDFDLYKRIFNGKSGPNFARFRMEKKNKKKQTNKLPDFSVSSQKKYNDPPFFKKNFHIWYGAKFG
jgi:hypothetical protein